MDGKHTERKTILVVDDTPENIDILRELLKVDYTVKAATKGEKAVEIARTSAVDLILLDIMMPGMNGYEVCKLLKQDSLTREIPVIFVTALQEVHNEAEGFAAGAVDYITKPISAPIVLARVKTHLALKDAQERLHEWNSNLKKRLLQSVATIREKSLALVSTEEKSPGLYGYTQIVEIVSGIFERMGDRHGIHARTVSELAGDAARKLNLGAEMVAKVRLAGLLHDVGKIGAEIHDQPHEMSSAEEAEYRQHPARGQDILKPLEEMHDVGLMIRGHHEAFNGSGYPDGLRGEEIPLGARLVAMADFIEQAANSVSELRAEYAMTKVRLHAGTLLDPQLIPYFQSITRIVYFEKATVRPTAEVRVPYSKLIAGLALSRDLVNTSGVLLLKKGDELDQAGIGLIRQNFQMKLLQGDIWVYVDQ
ncbi:two-component system response regulator [Geobacter sp. SVR]|uniref:response regulator n=1 Tax=Geobacter sp. SVR TaxID=2495594 RepID=UPI00143EF592|nr:HD domain-containing phosphohydrolase [Geobacter sp. SVR]BCS55886.1 two-component system response regulator [Geobacter sp. SVR]GCF83890.1 two-component system response regulator [Geobacter sp. SVR]